ncbi:MAG: hypothetical protein ACKVQB_11875 [Bacteroidia bacterium]
MKIRIALLISIIFGLPLIFLACDPNPCGPFKESFFTYSKVENHLMKQNFIDPYEKNDTTTEDTIRVNMVLRQDFVTRVFEKSTSYGYSALACSPPEPRAKNKITNLIFGLFLNGDTLNTNEAFLTSLVLRIPLANYQWPQNKDAFFSHFNIAEPNSITASFLSPQNSTYVQFVTWAIKENGDTLKAISQKIFCK